jgi:hypothetical protein
MKPGDLVIHYDSSECTPPEPVLIIETQMACASRFGSMIEDPVMSAYVMNNVGIHEVLLDHLGTVEDYVEED